MVGEALANRGYGHADNDSTDELARKLKLFLEDLPWKPCARKPARVRPRRDGARPYQQGTPPASGGDVARLIRFAAPFWCASGEASGCGRIVRSGSGRACSRQRTKAG